MEERLLFYETGEAPKRNVDVMMSAIAEVKLLKTPSSAVAALWVTLLPDVFLAIDFVT